MKSRKPLISPRPIYRLGKMALLASALTFGLAARAQVATMYTFAQSSGTYTAITTGGGATALSVTTWDDQVVNLTGLPNFTFNGTSYTALNVNMNGYITFGATAPSGTGYTPISATTGYAGAISAFGRDLINNGVQVYSQIVGSETIIQWNNARRYSGGAITGDVLNFQIRLNNTTGAISIVYGTCTATNATAYTCQVGLRGATNADYNNRTTATNWATTTAGGANSSTVTSSNTIMPASGLKFTWAPPSPTIAYTALAPTCSGSARTLSAAITDPDGVPTAGAGLPVLYWKINAGAYTPATGTFISGSQYDFSFGAGVGSGDVVSYYIVAQDNLGTANAFPKAGTGGYTSSPPASGTPPTTPSSYAIQNTLAGGTYTVGSGGAYATLTAAVAAYNTSCLGGPVTFSLISATYPSETYPVTINGNADANAVNTLTIKPAVGVSPAFSGNNINGILRLNGADYVTIDGSNAVAGTTRDLTITNTNTGASATVWLNSVNAGNGATNNTVKNCTIFGYSATTSLAALISSGATMGNAAETANTGNTYQNNAFSRAQYGIGVVGPATMETGTVITGNTIGSTIAADKIGYRGMFISNQQGVLANNNLIDGVTTSTTSNSVGIIVVGLSSGGSIIGNQVRNVANTNTGGYGSDGIYLGATSTASGLTIANNFVSGVTGYGYTSIGIGDNGYGIAVVSGGGYNIWYNTVSMNVNQTSGTYQSAALWINSALTAGSLDVRNNIFASSQTTGTQRYAVYCGSANTVFSAINYNDYATVGANLGYLGSNQANLPAMVAGFGGNANSLNITPVFTSATDLHLIPASNTSLNNQGTYIATVTTDIDGATRDVSTPDMGADEFAAVCFQATGTASAVNAGCDTYQIQVNITGTGDSPGGLVDIQVDGVDVVNNANVAGSPYVLAPLYLNGSTHTVTLQHLGNALCDLMMPSTTSNVSCDDNNPTTTDACVSNACTHTPIPCDDGDPCTINDVLVQSSTTQNFDGVTIPALPFDWVSHVPVGTGAQWATTNSFFDVFQSVTTDNPGSVSEQDLTTPTIGIVTASAQLTFKHRWAFESSTLPATYDGGVLEISINGGAFTDIVTAGGSFVTGGYNSTVSNSFSNPLGGRNAWGNNSGGVFITTTVNLPAAAAGQPIKLRWRFGSDSSGAGTGWWIDTFSVTEIACQGTPIAAPTASISGGGTVCSIDPLPNVVFTFTGMAPYTFTYTGPGGHTETNWPTTTYTITNAAVGTYTVTALSVNGGCNGSSLGTPVAVSVQAAPNAGTGSSVTYCSSSAMNDMALAITGAGGGGSWSPAGPNYDATTMSPGTYTYTVTAISPCAVNATAQVVVSEQAPPDAGSNSSFVTCNGAAPFSLLALLGGSPQGGGSWIGPDPVVSDMYDPSTMDPGTYTYTVVGVPPCSGSASASVVVSESGNQVVLRINTDGNASEISWVIKDAANATVASGSPVGNNQQVDETLCLSNANGDCYTLNLMDSNGNGITGGGWELRTTDGKVLLGDAFPNGADSPSLTPAYAGYTGHSFCLPPGPAKIANKSCGIFNFSMNSYVYCSNVAGAGSYQFEFSNPDAGYLRRIAVNTNKVRFNQMNTSPLTPGVKYFVRVRTDNAGPLASAHFGTGCEVGITSTVPCTELISAPTYGHSCNENRTFNTNNSFIYATPVVGATEYQFRIFIPSEGYDETFIRSTYILQLKWNNHPPMVNGSTYSVQVNVKVGTEYSGFCGNTCTITIDNGARPDASMEQANGTATMWPNPVRESQVNLSIDGIQDADQQITVDIQDIYGKQVFAKAFGNSGERFTTILDLPSDIASGVYMVNITVNGQKTVQRLSIIK
ncbi:MAG: T9SS type A sorting domain-containing protein [Flavobacteriales bacterium]|nr:MAG: T9SS type A sorting domain-containing protein [Flavobacteriales bacterium]